MITRRAAVLGATATCSLPFLARAQTLAPTKLRYLSFYGSIQAFELANELGYFDGTGIKLEPKGYATGGPESIMAMVAGDIELSVVAIPAILNAISGGNDLVATYPTLGGEVPSKFYVLEDSPIRGVGDLSGKTIAINTLGAHLDFAVREALRKASLRRNSVKLIAVPNPQLEQVLRAGQADVVAVGNWVSIFQGAIEKKGGVRVLFTDSDIFGRDLSHGFALMTRSFADRHPEVTRQFTLQSARAHEFCRANLGEARKRVAEILEKRGESADAANYFLGFGVRPGGLGTLHDLQFWIDLMEREKLLPHGRIDARKIILITADDVIRNKI